MERNTKGRHLLPGKESRGEILVNHGQEKKDMLSERGPGGGKKEKRNGLHTSLGGETWP